MGARAYDASEGRFTSVDPIQGGCANGYVYGFGDPFTELDLTGQASCGSVLGGAALDVAAIGVGIVAIVGSGGTLTGVALAAGASILATGSVIISQKGCNQDHDKSACVNMWIGYAGQATPGFVFLPAGAYEALGDASFAGTLYTSADATHSQPSVGSCLKSAASSAWNTVKSWF